MRLGNQTRKPRFRDERREIDLPQTTMRRIHLPSKPIDPTIVEQPTFQVEDMSEDSKPNRTDLFPYAVSKDAQEAPALTWVRNHSSYMTVGGFLNSLQVVGVYVRGILLNLVVLAPLVLLTALIPARFHHSLLNYPFVATGIAFAVFAFALTVFLARGPTDLVNGCLLYTSPSPRD